MSDYPVYVSPDGKNKQVVASAVRRVQLEHAGWRPKQDTAPAQEPPKPTRKTTAGQTSSDTTTE